MEQIAHTVEKYSFRLVGQPFLPIGVVPGLPGPPGGRNKALVKRGCLLIVSAAPGKPRGPAIIAPGAYRPAAAEGSPRDVPIFISHAAPLVFPGEVQLRILNSAYQ